MSMMLVLEVGETAVPGAREDEELRAEEPLAEGEVRTRGESVTTVPGMGVVVAEMDEEAWEEEVLVLVTLIAEAVGLGEAMDVEVVDEVSKRGGIST